MRDRKLGGTPYVVVATTLGMAISGFAQASDQGSEAPVASSDAVLGEVVVTARRVEERLQDVPISITVFNQEQLASHNVVNAEDLAAYTPSLSANSQFGPDNSTFAIRGFVQDIGTPPSVGVYFADVVAPRGPSSGQAAGDGAGPGNMFDLQNIQVLKGPQGTLFGRNTTGGAVLFVPQKPTASTEGYIEASYGNYDMRRVQAVFNTPIGDAVRFRIAVDDQRRDGYLTNNSGIGPSSLGDVNYTAVRASLVVDLTSNLENYTIGSFSRSDTDGTVEKLLACNTTMSASNLLGPFACAQLARENGARFYTVDSDLPHPESLLEQWQVINTTTWHSSDTLTLKNIASYAILKDTLNSALFGTNWPLGAGQPPLAFALSEAAPGLWGTDEYTITEEMQAQGSAMAQRLTYQGGAYVELSNPVQVAGTQPPVLLSCANAAILQCTDPLGIAFTGALGFPINVGSETRNLESTSYHDEGVYEQATYHLTQQLSLTEGLRYTWDLQRNTTQEYAYSFPVTAPFTAAPVSACTNAGTAPGCYFSTSARSRAPTWVVDLEYKPVDDLMIYGKYSRGYRAGGVFPPSPANYRVFDPEKVDTYEVGEKFAFRGPVAGTFDVTAFYNDFRNQQIEAGFLNAPGAPVGPTTGIINAGKSRIYGAEVEASISPFAGLTLAANYTYLNAQITSIAPLVSTDPNYVITSQIPAGAPLALSPRNKYTLDGSYTLPLDQRVGKVSLGVTFSHTDSQISNYDYYGSPGAALRTALGGDFGTLQARNLLDLSLGWKSIIGSPIDLAFFATNLTNRQYYTYIPGLGGSGFETASLGLPRLFGMRLRYRFGGRNYPNG
jgi:iron complex outermembrane receptor protein